MTIIIAIFRDEASEKTERLSNLPKFSELRNSWIGWKTGSV